MRNQQVTVTRTGLVLAVIAASWLSLGASCGPRQAQTALQTSLTGLAQGVTAAGEITLSELPGAAASAMEESPSFEVYQERMRPWSQLADGIEAAQASLRIAQAGLTAWIESGNLPDTWPEVCQTVEDGVTALVDLLRACGIAIPPALEQALPYTATLCTYFTGSSDHAQSH